MARAQKIYWTDTTRGGGHDGEGATIGRANSDGSQKEVLIEKSIDCPIGLVIDHSASRIFWADCNTVRVANLDGSSPRKWMEVAGAPMGLALDSLKGRLYWSAYTYEDSMNRDAIYSANLDGSDVTKVVDVPNGRIVDMVVDPIGGKIYWCGTWDFMGGIRRSNLDGSEMEAIVAADPVALTLDTQAGFLYWSTDYYGELFRCNLDGSDCQSIAYPRFDSSAEPNGLAFDPENSKIYWGISRSLFRLETDGTNFEELPLPATRILVDGDSLLTTSICEEKIRQSNLDGQNQAVIMSSVFSYPSVLAIDTEANWLYWADAGPYVYEPKSRIQRSRLDGTDIETIQSNLFSVGGLAVESNERKLYWTTDEDGGNARVRRSNLDGSNPEDVIIPPGGHNDMIQPRGIALDMESRVVYWTDIGTNEVNRSSLDSTLIELVNDTNGSSEPQQATLEFNSRLVYWTESNDIIPNPRARIARTKLDGGVAETVISTSLLQSATFPFDLKIDAASKFIYWSDIYAGKIQRAILPNADLDSVVDVVTELRGPHGIALDPRVPGDCASDGSVTLLDVKQWSECLLGPEELVPNNCLCSDSTGNGRVDLRDLAEILPALSDSK